MASMHKNTKAYVSRTNSDSDVGGGVFPFGMGDIRFKLR